MDGILNVNKPTGKTSFDVVALLKQLSREKHVGHAGTLDPLASGVLPVCMGQGTRVIRYMTGFHKVYRARIELGIETDTYDAEGTVIARGDPSMVSIEQINSTLNLFRGPIQQVPPMFSALKHRGTPLYKLARSGKQVERLARRMEIFRLDLLDYQPPVLSLEIECSRGTYVRSLAHDLGQVLGCGASLSGLMRTKDGPFTVEDSVAIPELKKAFCEGRSETLLYNPDIVLDHLPAITVDEAAAVAIRNGNDVGLEQLTNIPESGIDAQEIARCRVYLHNGTFLAVLRYEQENARWHPERVFKQ